jgi:hypothetical protein
MKLPALLLLSIAIAAVGPISAHAYTYYVDAVSGNDNNAGTSMSSAWKTVSKVNSRTFGPGDSILFKRARRSQVR